MFNPLPLRLCCLAIMAPALTSEVATRARDKLTGAPTSPGTPLMNGRDHQISMSDAAKGSRDPGPPQPRSTLTPKTAQVVTISKDLQKKLTESGHLVGDGKTTEQAKGRSMVNMGSISSLSDLYRHQQLEVFGSTSIIQAQQLKKLIATSTSSPLTNSNHSTTSTTRTVPTTSNGTVSTTATKNIPAATLLRSKLSSSASLGNTLVSRSTASSSITTANISKVGPDKIVLKTPQQPLCVKPPVSTTGMRSDISQSRTTMTNGLGIISRPPAKPLLIPVKHVKSSTISSKLPASDSNRVNTTNAVRTNVSSTPLLLDSVARRQRMLDTRAERLLRRLRRLQSRQAISHTKQQLNQFVERQRLSLPGYGKNSELNLHTELLQTELLHSKGMSTAALVELVHKMQSTQSTLRQQLAMVPEPEEPTRLGEDRCADLERVAGHLTSNMEHLQTDLDSDATESSSGGESCDELDYDDDWDGKVARPPIQCRAEWHWSRDRAAVAARWTWLQAQVSDLEYRIRQQYDIYKQIRANKGNVVLGEPPPPVDLMAKSKAERTGRKLSPIEEKLALLQAKAEVSPANVSMLLSNVDKQSSLLTDQMGPLYTPQQSPISGTSSTSNSTVATPKTPSVLNGFVEGRLSETVTPRTLGGPETSSSPALDHTFQAARCRPVKSYRKRKLLRTAGLHHLNRKAARLSTVQCHCYPPVSSCAMCGGRHNNTISMDATTVPYSERVALLDVSYHSVLSFKQDVSLSTNFESMIKTGEWQQKPVPRTYKLLQPDRKKLKLKEVARVKKYQRKLKKNTSATILSSTKIRNKYEQKQLTRNLVNSPIKPTTVTDKKLNRNEIKLRKRKMRDALRQMKQDGISVLGESLSESTFGMKKKRNESAYDINNIVIPYSIAASTRVEKLHYKEIITPKWREVDAKPRDPESSNTESKPVLLKESMVSLERINSHWQKEQAPIGDEKTPETGDENTSSGGEKTSSCGEKTSSMGGKMTSSDLGTISDDVKTSPVDPEVTSGGGNPEVTSGGGNPDDPEIEDLANETFMQRHLPCELSEKKRFSIVTPATTQRRGRWANRTDSSASLPHMEPCSPDLLPLESPRAPTPTTIPLASPRAPTPTIIPMASPSFGPDELDDLVQLALQEASRRRSCSVSSSKSNRSRTASHSENHSLVEEERPVVTPWTKRTFPLTADEQEHLLYCPPVITPSVCVLPRPDKVTAKVVAEEMVTPVNPPGHHSDTSDDPTEDPDDPEWTVISERQQPSKKEPLVIKLTKR